MSPPETLVIARYTVLAALTSTPSWVRHPLLVDNLLITTARRISWCYRRFLTISWLSP